MLKGKENKTKSKRRFASHATQRDVYAMYTLPQTLAYLPA